MSVPSAVMPAPKMGSSKDYVSGLMALVKAKNPGETEFHQAVGEVVESLALVLDRHPEYRSAKILERIVEPARVLMFRVPSIDGGGREIGFLYGQYKRLANEFSGVLTGKGLNWGGSLIRPEATGYGCVYFAQEMLKTRRQTLEGKTCLVSGSGNVSQYTVEKLLDLGARPVTLSDSNGVIYD